MRNANIKYKGIYLEVHYTYTPREKGDYLTPDISEEVIIHKIFYNDFEVTEIYESFDFTIDQITVIILNSI